MAERLKELREGLLRTENKFQLSHEEQLKLKTMADEALHHLISQVGIFETCNLAIFCLLTYSYPCSLFWLIIVIYCGLIIGLIVPFTLAYNKLKSLNVWVHDLSIHKEEIDIEAGLIIEGNKKLVNNNAPEAEAENGAVQENADGGENGNEPPNVGGGKNGNERQNVGGGGNGSHEEFRDVTRSLSNLNEQRSERILMLQYQRYYWNQAIIIAFCAIVHAVIIPAFMVSHSCS